MYAGACFPRELSDDEWQQAFLIRELTEKQRQEAYDLGVTMAESISSGAIAPYDAATIEAALAGQAQGDM